MIFGVGIDAVKISRMEKISDGFINKYYHEKEIEEYKKLLGADVKIRNQYLASRFAVKEAYAKARGIGFLSGVKPSEVCTEKLKSGAPFVRLYGETLKGNGDLKCHVSITHEDDLAMAMVVLEN